MNVELAGGYFWIKDVSLVVANTDRHRWVFNSWLWIPKPLMFIFKYQVSTMPKSEIYMSYVSILYLWAALAWLPNLRLLCVRILYSRIHIAGSISWRLCLPPEWRFLHRDRHSRHYPLPTSRSSAPRYAPHTNPRKADRQRDNQGDQQWYKWPEKWQDEQSNWRSDGECARQCAPPQ